MQFETLLHQSAHEVEDLLNVLLRNAPFAFEIARPKKLVDAMRHGVLNGGKRLRPFIVMQSTALFDGSREAALYAAASLECVHCYSLIHDDLPAMDDDDLRRGQPTVHKAYDEATAILAGDALLTLAFELIADKATLTIAPQQSLALVTALARASGLGGMVGGQMFDLMAEQQKPDEDGIIKLQLMKTGALIRYACEAGAIISGASENERTRLAEFGTAIGLAFQLADDLLDVTADTAALGKTAGKDVAAGKATLVALHGVDWAREQLQGLIDQAIELLAPFGERAEILRQIAHFFADRKS